MKEQVVTIPADKLTYYCHEILKSQMRDRVTKRRMLGALTDLSYRIARAQELGQ